ncbi:MAG: hypothetical protein HW400_137 [Candidatus Levybacteria bacterium]|nr:hypothetical protein [Candidatus Levybacteria bacterium]
MASVYGLFVGKGVDVVGKHMKGLGRNAILELRKPVTEKRMQELRKVKLP